MTWTKVGDETFSFRAIREAGAGVMGWWTALMTYSAREETDGVLYYEDLLDAWGPLVRGEVERTADMLACLQLDDMAEVLLERARRETDRLVAHVTKWLRELGLLRKRPGPKSGWELYHPNGNHYLVHQPSRADNAKRRQRERYKKRRQRAVAEGSADVPRGVSDLEVEEIEKESSCPPKGWDGSIDQSKQPSEAELPLEEPEPLTEQEAKELAAALAPLPATLPRRPLMLALRRAATGLGVSREVLVAVVRETAAEGALRAATGALRNVGAWLAAVVAKKLRSADGGVASEQEHRRTMGAEGPKRSLEESRRLSEARAREPDAGEEPLAPADVVSLLRGWKPAPVT